MLVPLLIGSVMMVVNLGILVLAVSLLIRLLTRHSDDDAPEPSLFSDVWLLSLVMVVLMLGHMLQFATWALLFTWLGESAPPDWHLHPREARQLCQPAADFHDGRH